MLNEYPSAAAIVGCSAFASELVEALVAEPNVTGLAIIDSRLERAMKLAASTIGVECRAYADYRTAFAKERPAWVIVSDPELETKATIAATERGADVLLEPGHRTADHLVRLGQVASRHGRRVEIGYQEPAAAEAVLRWFEAGTPSPAHRSADYFWTGPITGSISEALGDLLGPAIALLTAPASLRHPAAVTVLKAAETQVEIKLAYSHESPSLIKIASSARAKPAELHLSRNHGAVRLMFPGSIPYEGWDWRPTYTLAGTKLVTYPFAAIEAPALTRARRIRSWTRPGHTSRFAVTAVRAAIGRLIQDAIEEAMASPGKPVEVISAEEFLRAYELAAADARS